MISEQLDLFGSLNLPEEEKPTANTNELPPNIRIRKLTARETWRLMGFADSDFDKAEKVNSNTQLYKQAGNSIVVACLEMIFGQMFEGKEDHWKRWLEEKCYEDSHQ